MQRPPLLLRILIIVGSLAMVAAFIVYAINTSSALFVTPQQKTLGTPADHETSDSDAPDQLPPDASTEPRDAFFHTSKSIRLLSADDMPGNSEQPSATEGETSAKKTQQSVPLTPADRFMYSSKSGFIIKSEDLSPHEEKTDEIKQQPEQQAAE